MTLKEDIAQAIKNAESEVESKRMAYLAQRRAQVEATNKELDRIMRDIPHKVYEAVKSGRCSVGIHFLSDSQYSVDKSDPGKYKYWDTTYTYKEVKPEGPFATSLMRRLEAEGLVAYLEYKTWHNREDTMNHFLDHSCEVILKFHEELPPQEPPKTASDFV